MQSQQQFSPPSDKTKPNANSKSKNKKPRNQDGTVNPQEISQQSKAPDAEPEAIQPQVGPIIQKSTGIVSVAALSQNARTTFLFKMCIGSLVRIRTEQGKFEGILFDVTAVNEKESSLIHEVDFHLKHAVEIQNPASKQTPQDKQKYYPDFNISSKGVTEFVAKDIKFQQNKGNSNNHDAAGFAIDTEISKKNENEKKFNQTGMDGVEGERELVRWTLSEEEMANPQISQHPEVLKDWERELEDVRKIKKQSGGKAIFNQMEVNKKKFGYTTTYSFDNYTTALDKDSQFYKEHETYAEKMAREIDETSKEREKLLRKELSQKSGVEKDQIQNQLEFFLEEKTSKDGIEKENEELDEEKKFSSVNLSQASGADGPGKKYVPPNLRKQPTRPKQEEIEATQKSNSNSPINKASQSPIVANKAAPVAVSAPQQPQQAQESPRKNLPTTETPAKKGETPTKHVAPVAAIKEISKEKQQEQAQQNVSRKETPTKQPVVAPASEVKETKKVEKAVETEQQPIVEKEKDQKPEKEAAVAATTPIASETAKTQQTPTKQPQNPQNVAPINNNQQFTPNQNKPNYYNNRTPQQDAVPSNPRGGMNMSPQRGGFDGGRGGRGKPNYNTQYPQDGRRPPNTNFNTPPRYNYNNENEPYDQQQMQQQQQQHTPPQQIQPTSPQITKTPKENTPRKAMMESMRKEVMSDKGIDDPTSAPTAWRDQPNPYNMPPNSNPMNPPMMYPYGQPMMYGGYPGEDGSGYPPYGMPPPNYGYPPQGPMYPPPYGAPNPGYYY